MISSSTTPRQIASRRPMVPFNFWPWQLMWMLQICLSRTGRHLIPHTLLFLHPRLVRFMWRRSVHPCGRYIELLPFDWISTHHSSCECWHYDFDWQASPTPPSPLTRDHNHHSSPFQKDSFPYREVIERRLLIVAKDDAIASQMLGCFSRGFVVERGNPTPSKHLITSLKVSSSVPWGETLWTIGWVTSSELFLGSRRSITMRSRWAVFVLVGLKSIGA